MSNLKHTPEPWVYEHSSGYLRTADSDKIIDTYNDDNGKRIVDCVNALAGIEAPSHFIGIAKNYMRQDTDIRTLINADENESTIDEVARLEAQRDSLMEVVETIANLTPSTHADKLEAFFNSVKSAKQAITKVKKSRADVIAFLKQEQAKAKGGKNG
jgi:hypothetical protein